MEEQKLSSENQEFNQCNTTMASAEKKSKKCHLAHCIVYGILFIAVIGLYILHFTAPKAAEAFVPEPFTGDPGTGEVVYVNLDSINANYKLIQILNDEIEREMQRQEAVFSNKMQDFERKFTQFQANMQEGVLTQVQVENTQQLLQQEYEQLEIEREQVMMNLQAREMAAVQQMYDSLEKVTTQYNQQRNASYVISYQKSTPFVIIADPSKDITNEILFNLNKTVNVENEEK